MDMKSDVWYAQLQLTGTASPEIAHGSISYLFGWAMTHLRTTRPRQGADGREINLLIRDTPFKTLTKEHESLLRKAREVEAGLDTSNMTRNPDFDSGETFEQFLEYLLSEGLIPSAADMIARDWYQLPPNQDLLNWLADPKAARFRLLNSLASEFEKALPSEYAELKHYVMTQYPQFVENLTFRTA